MVVKGRVRDSLADLLDELLHATHDEFDGGDVHALAAKVFDLRGKVDPRLFPAVSVDYTCYRLGDLRVRKRRRAARSLFGSARWDH